MGVDKKYHHGSCSDSDVLWGFSFLTISQERWKHSNGLRLRAQVMRRLAAKAKQPDSESGAETSVTPLRYDARRNRSW